MTSHAAMTCLIEYIGCPRHHKSEIAAEFYSQDIDKQNNFRHLFKIFLIGYRDIQVRINFGIISKKSSRSDAQVAAML